MNYLPVSLRHPLAQVITERVADLDTDTLTTELATVENVNLEKQITEYSAGFVALNFKEYHEISELRNDVRIRQT